MKFVQAKNYTKNHEGSRKILWLVVHDMESPEKPDTAEAVADWFAGDTAPQASAHYCIDNNSIVHSVWDKDIAWAAPGANHSGLHFEFAGRAAQKRGEWLDDYGLHMLNNGALLFAAKAHQHDIVPVRRWAYGVAHNRSGITSHLDITESGIGGPGADHHDPGNNFPWDYFMGRVHYWYDRPESRKHFG